MKKLLYIFSCSLVFVSHAQFPVAPVPDYRENSNPVRIGIKYGDQGAYLFRENQGKYEQVSGFYDNIDVLSSKSFIVTMGSKKGLVNDSGLVILPIKYDSLTSFRGTTILAYEQGKCGLYGNDGELLLSPKIQKVLLSNNWMTLVENEKKTYDLILNRKDSLLVSNIDFVEFFNSYTIVKKAGQFAVFTNEIVIPFSNDSISGPKNKMHNKPHRMENIFVQFSFNVEPFYFISFSKSGRRLLSNSGREIYPFPLNNIICHDKNGYCLTKKDEKFSIFFTRSNETTGFDFDQVSHDLEGFITVSIDKKRGVFDLSGKLIAPIEYDEIFLSDIKDYFYVTKNCKKGLLNIQGELIIPIEYDKILTSHLYYSKVVLVSKNEKNGVLDFNGKVIIPLRYNYVYSLGAYAVVINENPVSKYGLFNQEGLLYKVNYKTIDKVFSSNVIYLKDFSNRITLIGVDSNKVIAKNITKFHLIHDENQLYTGYNGWSNSYISVRINKGKYGVVNIFTKKMVIPVIYDSIYQSLTSDNKKKTYFVVRKGKQMGLIDEQNSVIIPFQYSSLNLDLTYQNRNLEMTIVAEKDGKFGVINLKNEEIIPFEYDTLQRIFQGGIFKAKKNNNLYQIIDIENKPLTADFYDEVSLFYHGGYEKDEDGYLSKSIFKTHTFRNGYMRELRSDGTYLSGAISMKMHQGFRTFEELKNALILALNNPDDSAIMDFVEKLVPSPHIIHVLKQHESINIRRLNFNTETLKNRHFDLLVNFKRNKWNATDKNLRYDRSLLSEALYTTGFSYGLPGIAKISMSDLNGFHDKTLNLIFEDCIRVNGLWISSYIGE